MAKKKNDLAELTRNLRRGIKITFSKARMREIGLFALFLIVVRTRKGQGVSKTGGRTSHLKSLSKGYIEFRTKHQRKLGRSARVELSNLSARGLMLSSMRVKSSSNLLVRWGPSKKLRTALGAKSGARKYTNEQIGEFVSKERPFNHLSNRELELVTKFIDRLITANLKKIGI